MNELENILYRLLLAQLQSIGLFTENRTDVSTRCLISKYKIPRKYIEWMKWTFELLDNQGVVTYDKEQEMILCTERMDIKKLWLEWDGHAEIFMQNADAKALVKLTDLTIHSLPEILIGKDLATNVMFPNGSMEYIEGIYKNNKIADYFNDILTDALIQCVEAEIADSVAPSIMILEIGAGSGGTSALVLKKLQPYKKYIKEYCYTDISKVFLDFGEKTFGKNNDFLTYKLFDVENTVEEQGFQIGQYDFIIATNVLHATSRIKNTLANAKALLREGGILLINEISSSTVFNHLTFGILDGWWKYEDKKNRIPGCPGLFPEVWERILGECGFDQVLFPASEAHDLGQQIIVAQSNGVVYQEKVLKIKPVNKSAGDEHRKTIKGTKEVERYILDYIVEVIATVLGMNVESIDIQHPFSEYGMDSIMGTTLVQKINEGLNISLQAIDLFDYTTVEQLSNHIKEEFGDKISLPAKEVGEEIENEKSAMDFNHKTGIEDEPIIVQGSAKDIKPSQIQKLQNERKEKSDIAIIGYSGRFSNADNVEEFWEHLERGDDLIHTIERWNLSNEEILKNVKKPLSNRAGLLNDIDKFDPLFFNISGREATYMDPQQRLFLEEAWKAMEDSGYCSENVSGLSCGVYVACGGNDYMNLFDQKTPEQAFWGNMASATAARISYYLNLKGPAIAIDTACSSSLVAIHLACQGLWSGETDMALAGGVALQCTPNLIVAEERVGMLSPDGRCYTFDNRANGFAYGEGVAAIVLKRLDDALRDGDSIHGVIVGSGINQDGATNGLTAPSAKAQEKLERQVYDTFHIEPEKIQMVEAHGTGTKLGDPIEIQALTRAFRAYTEKKGYCAIGSVKTNIGHTQYAAGVAGVIKILLSMKHKKIPASINFEKSNENIDFQNTPFFVNTETRKWECKEGERMQAAISSFGASGTNAHMVIVEAPSHKIKTKKKDAYFFGLSAKTKKQLRKQAEQIVAYWKSTEEKDCGNMSFTMLEGRKHFKYRLACVGQDILDACCKLEKWIEEGTSEGVYIGEQKRQQKSFQAYDEDCIENCIKGLEYRKNLDRIAKLFTEGYVLPYGNLFKQQRYQRISMPTYPFEKERYWIEAEEGEKQEKIKESIVKVNRVSSEVKLYTEEWVEEAITEEKIEPEVIVCMVSEQKKQEEIVKRLRQRAPQTQIIFVKQKDSNVNSQQDVYEIDRTRKEDYINLFEAIKKQYGKISAIAYMWPLEDIDCVEDYMVMVYLIQALAEVRLHLEQILYAGAYLDDWSAGLLDAAGGFGTSLNSVFPDMKVYTVCEDCRGQGTRSSWGIWVERIWNELCYIDKKSVLYHNEKRLVAKQVETNCKHEASLLQEGGVYFITGGAGKLLFELEKELARKYRANMVLLGRNEIDYRIQQKIKELEEQGGHAIYIQGDVCRKDDVIRALRKAKKIYGNVNGLIHGAGTQGEGIILQKTSKNIMDVLAPKIQGTKVLNEVFQAENLDFRCYVSSSSAILGDFGGCDYAIANRFLMSYGRIQNQKSEEVRTLVINWPMWKEGRMGFADEEGKKVYLTTSGFRELETEEGISLWMRLLEKRTKMQYMVLAGEDKKVSSIAKNAGSLGKIAREKIHNQSALQNVRSKAQITTEQKKGLRKQLMKDLKQEAGNLLNVPIERIDIDSNFGDFGFDSISLTEFAEKFQNKFDIMLSPAVFFNYTTIEKLAKYLEEQFGDEIQRYYFGEEEIVKEVIDTVANEVVMEAENVSKIETKKVIDPYNEPIAIIGMSGRFPGARDTERFWDLLEQGKSGVESADENYFERNQETNKKWKCGWIQGVAEFEPLFFEISPKEAEMMDPRHRLLLQESWRALEDAGYEKKKLKEERIGMFVGAEGGDYRYVSGFNTPITSNHEAILSARLSYFLDLTGPNMTINTACSSSLVAAHQACQSLRSGECDAAIAAGVNLILSSRSLDAIGNAGMISESGVCYAFDKRADGMVPAEAIAVVVLKRLSQAEKDGDPIYAVIKGSGINYDGKTNGITSPSGLSQKRLIKEVYEKYHINAEEIGYVSAHGTGTRLGDPVEINALSEAYRSFTQKENYCALVSTKTNIGHTFAASGLVGLIGMVKSMENGKIPASLNFEEKNEYINWEKSPFYVNTQTKEWKIEDGKKRMGVVSAFGMSGTNAHMIIEEYKDNRRKAEADMPFLFLVSAKKEKSLAEKIVELKDYLKTSNEMLKDIAYTLMEGRQHFEYRCAFIAETQEEALSQLEKLEQRQKDDPMIIYNHVQNNKEVDDAMANLNKELSKARNIRERFIAFAKYYCEGMSLQWSMLDEYQDAKKVHMTLLYPFVRKNYWLQASDVDNQKQKKQIVQEQSVLEIDPIQLQPIDYVLEKTKKQEITVPVEKVPKVGKNKKILETDHLEIIETMLIESLMTTLLIERSEVDVNTDFITMGLDSIVGVEWIQMINKNFGIDLKVDIIYKYPTIHELAKYFYNQSDNTASISEEEVEIINLTVEAENIAITLERGEEIQDETDQTTQPLIKLSGNEPVIEEGIEKNVPEAQRLTEQNKEKIGVSEDQIFKWLKDQLLNMLALEEKEVSIGTNLSDVGLDSILGVEWIQSINQKFDINITADKIYQYPTVKEMAQYIYRLIDNAIDVKEEIIGRADSSDEVEDNPMDIESLVQQVVTSQINLDDAEQIYKKL